MKDDVKTYGGNKAERLSKNNILFGDAHGSSLRVMRAPSFYYIEIRAVGMLLKIDSKDTYIGFHTGRSFRPTIFLQSRGRGDLPDFEH